jgi:hypothetical protein
MSSSTLASLMHDQEQDASENHQHIRKEELQMSRIREASKIGFMAVVIALAATPAFARGIELKGGGTALWIFLIVGAVIVFLQLIPALILFFSFVGTVTTTTLKPKKVEDEVVLPQAEPVVVKR